MRKNLLYAGLLLLGMTVVTGCSNEESLEQVASNGKTYAAIIENATEARTSVSDDYKVLWTENDAFSVFDNGTKKATLTLSDGEGTTSGKFTIDDEDVTITEDMVALFPESETLGYTFATNYISQETDAPMLGTFENGKFTFSLLTAMVRVVVTNVPAGNATLTITADSNIKLTGDAILNANNVLNDPTNGSNAVTVTIDNQTAGATLTFDVPVPVNNYSGGLDVKLKVGNDVVFNKKTNGFPAAAGKIYVFGATYVSIDDANVQATLQEALESGEAVILTGDEDEVSVPSLSLPANTTAVLDLNGKTMILGAATSTYAAPRAAEETGDGLVNKGNLTIVNGTIEGNTNSYVIKNDEGATMTIDACSVGGPVYNLGNMTVVNDSKLTTDAAERAALICGDDNNDIDWTFTMTGGSIESEQHTAVVVKNNYYGLNPQGLAKFDDVIFKGSATFYDLVLCAVNVEVTNCTFTNDRIWLKADKYVSYVNGNETRKENLCPCKWSEIFGTPITTFEALATALDAAPTDGTATAIVLGDNIDVTSELEISSGKNITLHLNGHTLAINAINATSDGIDNAGTLTILGDEGKITWETQSGGMYCIINRENATMTIDACSVGGLVYNLGNMTVVNDSKLTTDAAERAALICGDDNNDIDWTFTMTGGSIESEQHTAVVVKNNYYGLNPQGLAKFDDVIFKGSATFYDLVLCAVNVEVTNCTFTNDRIWLKADKYVSYVNGNETRKENLCPCKWSEIFPTK